MYLHIIKIKLLIFVFVVCVNITYSLTQLNTSGFVRHAYYIIYIWTKGYSTNEAISYTHNYCEQAVIRLYYTSTECNNTENTT